MTFPKSRAARAVLALVILNELRGLAVVASIVWGWIQTTT